MMDENIMGKIKLFMNVQAFLGDRRLPTDEYWDNYFIQNYNNDTGFIFEGEDFLAYDEDETSVYIKDFICNGTGLRLFNELAAKKKSIRAMVHTTNTRLLNVMMGKLRFKIIELVGNQYLCERRR